MKIQSLAVIFIIIILPISLVISSYTQNRVETLRLQTTYDSKLNDSTHDALKAYQLNSFASETSTIIDEKIRDINASANTFFNSLASNFATLGYTKSTLQNYVPALVYTMYDGYYIYSPYKNTWSTDSGKTEISGEMKEQIKEDSQKTYSNGENLYGLKPYIYYSCRYKKGDLDLVITYSLDNYIEIEGSIDGKTVSRYGYLLSNLTVNGYNVTYNGVDITAEGPLSEKIYLQKEDGTAEIKELNYIKKDGVKYYTDGSTVFSVLNGKKFPTTAISVSDINNNENAKKYFKESADLMKFMKDKGIDSLTTDDIVKTNNEDDYTAVGKIFDFSQDIELETSNFNIHRMEVIKHSIEKNLSVAISNFNNYSGVTTDFQMPKLKEEDWDKIMGNISVISFLQGINIGGKVYNGYSVITNTKNEDVVMLDSIYVKKSDGMHRITENGLTSTGAVGIFNVNLEARTESDGTNYLPIEGNLSYDSVITQNGINTSFDDSYDGDLTKYVRSLGNDLKKMYYTALARERYGIYRPRVKI